MMLLDYRKVEDLQFTAEEAAIDHSDLQVMEQSVLICECCR